MSQSLVPANLNELMESSDVVGNIRFSHPTLYVFPGGQGDAALFGINGFNMLGKIHLIDYKTKFSQQILMVRFSLNISQLMVVSIENLASGISLGIWIV